MKKIILLLLAMPLLASCYYDSEEALNPVLPGDCDTTIVYFSTDIVPILQSSCMLCHSNAAAASLGNNIKLEDYTDLADRASIVLGTIKHSPGYSPMPKGGGSLTQCSIDMFEAWINQGKPDN